MNGLSRAGLNGVLNQPSVSAALVSSSKDVHVVIKEPVTGYMTWCTTPVAAVDLLGWLSSGAGGHSVVLGQLAGVLGTVAGFPRQGMGSSGGGLLAGGAAMCGSGSACVAARVMTPAVTLMATGSRWTCGSLETSGWAGKVLSLAGSILFLARFQVPKVLLNG